MSKKFPSLKPAINLPQTEGKVLSFWKKNKIFEKTLARNKGKRRFVFFEGPPSANAAPGLHHVEARAFKDLIPRYKTMQGFLVERKAGWDTQGLPIEMSVEKELGISSKSEIEKFGIAKFNALAKKVVWQFKEEWEKLTERMGFWLDLKNPYVTYDADYIETLWWILKQVWDRGLLYQGHKVVPHCPRCGTALSSHEVALGYREVIEDSIFVKFRIKAGQRVSGLEVPRNIYILAWTTTPWTLPGNVALAVDPSISYLEVAKEGEHLIVAEKLAKKVLDNFKIIKKLKGKDLVGLEYEPLFEGAIKTNKKAWYVVPADFVTTEEGTGVVHTAVMYGEDDYNLGKKFNLPAVHTVDEAGKFLPSVKKWAGRFVKDRAVEKEIVEDLKTRGLLLKVLPYTHDYPFCWRCDTPLLYYAKNSWFIKMSAIKNKLVANNRQINWVPANLKEGRFGEWLREVKDWAISRERYWGTPLPIWINKKGERICVGSFAELQKLAKEPKLIAGHSEFGSKSGKKIPKPSDFAQDGQVRDDKKRFDPHRPFIDDIVLVKNGEEYRRVPEVVDVWFDSGAMPFAQWHYPFANKERIDKKISFPADFIAEAVDQTRGWFYTLLAVSTLLKKGPAYKNVISLGHVLDKHGKKMSKSKGNAVDPFEVMNQFGADALRFYFYSVNQPGLPKNFDIKDVEEIARNLLLRLWNTLVFFTTYVDQSSFKPSRARPKPKAVLDKWILARLDEVTNEVTGGLDQLDTYDAAQNILKFVGDLSNWYLRRSRKRFFRNPKKSDEKEAYATLYYVLKQVVTLLAPFTPFMAEEMYQVLKIAKDPASVHLVRWPVVKKLTAVEKKILLQMQEVRTLVEEGLRLREEAGIRVRQPLGAIYTTTKLSAELSMILAEEINVEKVKKVAKLPSGKSIKKDKRIALETQLTDALKQEGLLREMIRFVQQKRKNLGLTVDDRAKIKWYSDDRKVQQLLRKRGADVANETLSTLSEGKDARWEKLEANSMAVYLQVAKK